VTTVERLARLRSAVEHLAEALSRASGPDVLGCEAAIEDALADNGPRSALSDGEEVELRRELERLRRALVRCRRLGASATGVVRASLQAQGREATYGRRVVATSG
jgi:hypothetical protein